jgi:hypothetical protein
MIIEKLKLAGKYLDQPLLVGHFKKAVPPLFIGGATLYSAKEVQKAPKEKKKQATINISCVMGATVVSALLAPKLSSKIVRKPYEKFDIKEIKNRNTKLIDNFLNKENSLSEGAKTILQKAKTKVLKYREVTQLSKETSKTDDGKKFFNRLIPEPENITAKDIRDDIARLSLMGAISVSGGVAGGIVGEKLSNKTISKSKTADRIKEGAYQYLANIFLCNVGAGVALGVMEKMNIKSKSARALGMIGGIVSTGIIGGSAIANYIGKKVINPLFEDKSNKNKDKFNKGVERTPEVLDLCLHSDDIATIAVMSGLKWIEPSLPILYGISGYRAGIGYRNGGKHHLYNN